MALAVTHPKGAEDAPSHPVQGYNKRCPSKIPEQRVGATVIIHPTNINKHLLCARTGASRDPSSWREVRVWDENILSSSQGPVRETMPCQEVQKRELKYRERAAKSIEKTETQKRGGW